MYYVLYIFCFFFFLRIRRPPRSPLFPSTTLSRSRSGGAVAPDPRPVRDGRAAAPAEGALPRVPASESRLPRRLLRSEEHTSELQSRQYLVCRLLLEKKKKKNHNRISTHIIIILSL